MSSAMERPEKIMVSSLGSRGDIQPFIALGKALLAAGYKVLVVSNVNLGTIVEECGLPFKGVFVDSEKFVRENDAMRESMAEGDIAKFSAGFAQALEQNAVTHASGYKQALTDFKPDLVIGGTLVEGLTFSTLFHYGIPTFFVRPSYCPPSPKRMIYGLPNLPFGLNGLIIQKVFIKGMWTGQKKADALTYEVAGHKISKMVPFQFLVDDLDNPTVIPLCMGLSTQWAEVMYPGIKPTVQCVGTLALTSEYQQEVANSEVTTNFGDTGELEKVRAFIAAGSKPIFMGWGSMTCKTQDHMMQLVASAVKLTGYRAIMQAGWAKLSLEVLEGCTKDTSLIEYVKQNVLFIGAAPHEWLFPQCACIVHHGGTGTTSCALRSGTPTVITPVFLDQFDHAYMVNALGVGVSFAKRQFQKISAKELSDAIVKCVGSDDIRAKAAEMGVAMHQQDGAKNVVKYIDEFWEKEVRTGRQQRLAQEVMQKNKASSTTCGCFPE